MNKEPTFELAQVIVNPRDGALQTLPFETFASLAEAKKAAKREFKKGEWVITESRVVAHSEGLSETA